MITDKFVIGSSLVIIREKTLKAALCIRSLPWGKLIKVCSKVVWGLVLFSLSLCIVFFKVITAFSENNDLEKDKDDDNAFDTKDYGEGSSYVDYSTGEESSTPLSGFKRI